MSSVLSLTRPGGWPEDSSPRSVLFNIIPYGCCGADREELGNYIARLAAEHRVSRGSLTRRVIGPAAFEIFKVNPQRLVQEVGTSDFAVGVSGVTTQAKQWANILNHLTRRDDLELCTLLPFKDFISTFKLQSVSRRCCPACYEDDIAAGRATYDRLLWRVAAVNACPIHELRLMVLPKEPGYIHRPELANNNRDDTAQRFLKSGHKRVPASRDEIEDARLVANLIDDSAAFQTMTYSVSAQSTFLHHVIDTFFDSKSAHFAAELGVGKSQVHAWVHGQVRMSLPRLLLVARCCSCEVTDILLGKQVTKHFQSPSKNESSRIIQHLRRGAKSPLAEIGMRLRKLLEDGEVSDASAASDVLDVSRKFLRRHFPVENALLVQRGEENRRASRREATEAFSRAYLAEHCALVDAGIYPARRLVLERVDVEVHGALKHRKVQRAQLEAHQKTDTPIARRGGPPVVRLYVNKT